MDKKDVKHMRRAIEEAKRDKREQPKVGAVIVKGGKVISSAHGGEHTRKGKPMGHAEYHAFRKAQERRIDISGATLYTTLEPCTVRHHPKIPCADRAVRQNIKRVVIGMLDPNPDIQGAGLALLDRNGVELALAPSRFRDEIESLNISFIRQQSDLSAIGLRRAYRDQATTALPKAILYAEEEVDILQTYIQHVNTWEASLLVALKRGATVRFLLMDPNENPVLVHRASDLGKKERRLKLEIEACINDIKEINRRSKHIGCPGKIHVHLYKGLPYVHMYRVDNRIWFSFFLKNRFGTSLPHFEVDSPDSRLGQNLLQHFRAVIEAKNTYRLNLDANGIVRLFDKRKG